MEMDQMRYLLEQAREVKKNAYSPYSNFSVGAALLAESGKIYKGCNIENASFSPTCCAERVAIFSALADGCHSFSAIAIVGDSVPCMPCGVCRQVLAEFCAEDMPVIYEGENGEPESVELGKLLPYLFKLKEK